MIRYLFGLLACGLAVPISRGNDDADLALRVKVALALACDCGKCDDTKTAAKASARLDWYVSTDAGVEVSPAPKVAKEKAKPAAPAPAPAVPAKQLWLMRDYWGNQWYEWRDPAPTPMPAPTLNWRVVRPPVFSPFAPCVGTV